MSGQVWSDEDRYGQKQIRSGNVRSGQDMPIPGQIKSYHVRIRHASLGKITSGQEKVRSCQSMSNQIRSFQVRSRQDRSSSSQVRKMSARFRY